MENQEVKSWLLSNLNTDKIITVKWDCGGDEAFIYPYIDGIEVEAGHEIHEEFEHFLIEKLSIPDAGEFTLQGKGSIFLENSKIVIEHSAEGKFMVDYDDENKQEIWQEISEKLTKSILFDI